MTNVIFYYSAIRGEQKKREAKLPNKISHYLVVSSLGFFWETHRKVWRTSETTMVFIWNNDENIFFFFIGHKLVSIDPWP